MAGTGELRRGQSSQRAALSGEVRLIGVPGTGCGSSKPGECLDRAA
ncbi:MAG: hypothetical protein ACXVFA_00970 [Solirubrobacteraceae bacterium]